MGSSLNALIKVEDTLRFLVEHLIDAQRGLQTIGDNLKNEPLKRYFLAESLKRAEFRGQIESILHSEGERDLHIDGTSAGKAIRAWAGLKAALGGGDHTLLGTAEEGETALLEAYADALTKDMPLPIRETLAAQAAHVRRSLERVAGARAGNAS